jgi:hypothetical protein
MRLVIQNPQVIESASPRTFFSISLLSRDIEGAK